MNTISFMSANYVARQLGYRMTAGWGEGERAASEYFRPLESFARRFEEIVHDVKRLCFTAMDVWTAHLAPAWATPEHIAIARDLLRQQGLTVPSVAGWFGSTEEEFEATCRVAAGLGAPVLAGSTSMLEKDREFVLECLERHDLRLGIENHPEKTPGELLTKVGDGGGGRIGVTIDTGWFATQGYDAAQAVNELAEHLLHIHLKDVREVGRHDTCRYAEGVVPLEACVRELRRADYRGAISVEHEPESFDPSEDCRLGREMLERWLGVAA